MGELIIRHVDGSEPATFIVLRANDPGKTTKPVPVVPPFGYPVEESANVDLMGELRWYLEDFLHYPFPPSTDRAVRAVNALQSWGTKAFTALFNDGQGRRWFDEASRDGHEKLHLSISSDDPGILGWPWEALFDPEAGYLGHHCQVIRKLNSVKDTPKVSEDLPTDRVNILMVTARQYKADVQYRTISRPLVELIEKKAFPAHVHILRPPTVDRLRQHLEERPGFYHILHFDGHGGYGVQVSDDPAGYTFGKSPKGVLVFENEEGEESCLDADVLSTVLREFRIPAVVMNACRSGMIDGNAEDPFASVAASLIKAGVGSVVAMAYTLYVSGAQEFLPAFYSDLFTSRSVVSAVRSGRLRMLTHKGRVSPRGNFPLEDWLLPVVYEQTPLKILFGKPAESVEEEEERGLPSEALDEQNPYGLIGRDDAVLELERAMRGKPAGILIQGLGGVGKTTLAAGFVRWLRSTEGLGFGSFWFRFDESVRSGESILNRIGEALFGLEFNALKTEQKLEILTQALRDNPFVIVWDNFETASGLRGEAHKGTLSTEDRALLKTFLSKLRGGKTKVIITSRSEEEWLGIDRRKIPLGGLHGEERWEYCESILRDLGVKADREDSDLVELMDLLRGHPLMMRVILPKLEKASARSIIDKWKTNLAGLDLKEEDEAYSQLYATLRLVEDSIPENLRELLIPLGLHERYIDGDYLEPMGEQVDGKWSRGRIDKFLSLLSGAGLLRDLGQSIHEIHPALTGYLRAGIMSQEFAETKDNWTRAFVDVMGSLADALAPKELHEQRFNFHLHKANFHHALAEAERLKINTAYRAILQSLAAYALNTRAYNEAEDLFQKYADAQRTGGTPEGEAGAYHQLGMIAQERRDFDSAEKWYHKALEISEKHGNEHGAASTYHQLGRIAEERRDFDSAEKWYHKSLEISERLGIEHGAAMTYHQLGIIAQERRDFDSAEKWYHKSLEISEKHGNEHGAAISYHELGMIAEERRDFDSAEKWYHKSLEIKEKHGNEHGAAITYHQLGMIAEERRDFDSAEKWYHKSLEIEEKHGNEHGAAITYGQLGIVALLKEELEQSGAWLIKSILGYKNTNDPASVERIIQNFMILYNKSPERIQSRLRRMWQDAGLGVLGGGDV